SPPRAGPATIKTAADVSVSDLLLPSRECSLHNSRLPPRHAEKPTSAFRRRDRGWQGLHQAGPVSVGSPALGRVEAPGPAPPSQIRVGGAGCLEAPELCERAL